jgi:hypothetical protein
MPDDFPTKAEFARSMAVTSQAISKAIREKRVILSVDGKINTRDPITRKYMHRDTNPRKVAIRAKPAPAKAAASPKIHPAPEPDIPPRPAGPITPHADKGDRADTAPDWDDLDAQKTREQIEKLRLENQSTRLELIPRDGVKHFVGQIASAHSSILLPLGGRLAKQIASELGVSDPAAIIRVEETIQAECYQVVGMIKRKIADYLANIKTDDKEPQPDLF